MLDCIHRKWLKIRDSDTHGVDEMELNDAESTSPWPRELTPQSMISLYEVFFVTIIVELLLLCWTVDSRCCSSPARTPKYPKVQT